MGEVRFRMSSFEIWGVEVSFAESVTRGLAGWACVVEFVSISSSFAIYDALSVSFVSEVASLVRKVVLRLFLDRKLEEFFHHFEEMPCILEQSLSVVVFCLEIKVEETELAAGAPASFILLCIVMQELCERDA